MRIVMAGASGFLGTHLRRRLAETGHEIVQLVRREPSPPEQRQWWPERRELDPEVLAGADAVVNLAGVGVGDRRWTESYKALIRSSRVDTTATIAAALTALSPQRRPNVLLNASGVHGYGDTGDNAVDEQSPDVGVGFLADLSRVWEGATAPAEDAGVRVVKLRTGLPLDAGGGLLKPMLLPFRLFLGGKLGDGRQWMPWISLADWLDAVCFLLDYTEVTGPVNLVGPAPTRNADFTTALAEVLHRPAFMPVPRVALRIVLGEFGDEAVQSLRVLPGVLRRAGFTFSLPDLGPALRAAFHQD